MRFIDDSKCVECSGAVEEQHHVVPRSVGGTFTVPLCSKCHGLAHGFTGREGHRELTRLGLAAAKARGVKLGTSGPANLRTEVRTKAAKEFANSLKATLDEMKSNGLSQRQQVEKLNTLGIKTPRGGEWSLVQLQRVIKRTRERDDEASVRLRPDPL